MRLSFYLNKTSEVRRVILVKHDFGSAVHKLQICDFLCLSFMTDPTSTVMCMCVHLLPEAVAWGEGLSEWGTKLPEWFASLGNKI